MENLLKITKEMKKTKNKLKYMKKKQGKLLKIDLKN